ncbi:MAG TPA: hypothetical protein DCG41_14710, partial [Verrucomicrobiales bacterium]|nr:hypothetical protein [Verrucomicrobiales bacterium]
MIQLLLRPTKTMDLGRRSEKSSENSEDLNSVDFQLEWATAEKGGIVGVGTSSLSTLLADLEVEQQSFDYFDEIALFLHAEHMLSTTKKLPGKNASQIKKALPFALEEGLTEDIENFHIATDTIKPGSPIRCRIIKHEELDKWRRSFRDFNIPCDFISAESDLLEEEVGVCSLDFNKEEVLVSAEGTNALILREQLNGILPTLACTRIVCRGGELTEIEKSQLPNDAIIENHEVGDQPEIFKAFLTNKDSFVNLLQGEYVAPKRSNHKGSSAKTIGGLAASLVIVLIGSSLIQGFWAKTQYQELSAQNRNEYKSLFPLDSVPVTSKQLKRRLEGKLGVSSQDSPAGISFIDLFGKTVSALRPNDQLQSLNFNQDKNELSIEVLLNTYDQLDIVRSSLESKGIAVEVASAEQEVGSVR